MLRTSFSARFPAALATFVLCAAASAAPDAQNILAASDLIRNPGGTFSVTTRLAEYRDGAQVGTAGVSVLSRTAEDTGQYNTLVYFFDPARDAGKRMLKRGNDLWFHDPVSQSSIRISPQQRLLGGAANGDVVTVNFAKDYAATLAAEEDITDGDRTARHCYRLALAARNRDVTYDNIEMWVDTANSRPVKARYYAQSGRLLKTAFYREYRKELGVERPVEIVIIDGLDPKWVTVMRFSDYKLRDASESWFQRDYLARFQPG
jgi:outer membrane lipoprotein-sorting protein